MKFEGKCHCANITFVLHWDGEAADLTTRACTCSFCSHHGAVWTAPSGASLRIAIVDEALVSRYAFGTKTAEFHVCARCGVVPVASSIIAGKRYAVVNVNTLVGVKPSLLASATANFDGEGVETRLSRRTRTWISDVTHSTNERTTAVLSPKA